jgi:hypothetical protein
MFAIDSMVSSRCCNPRVFGKRRRRSGLANVHEGRTYLSHHPSVDHYLTPFKQNGHDCDTSKGDPLTTPRTPYQIFSEHGSISIKADNLSNFPFIMEAAGGETTSAKTFD